MKFLKRALPIVLAVCLLASLGAVSAIDAGETRTVIGADLTDMRGRPDSAEFF